MHLKSMRFWMFTYIGQTLFDVIVTYIFVSQEPFGIADEGNALIRSFMEQYGIWQGLSLYVMQEFLLFFFMWGFFYYIIKHLIKGRSEKLHFKIDMLVFNLGVPFMIMASALLHLFGGIFWIVLGLTGDLGQFFPLQFIVYITILCGIFQAYQMFKLNSKYDSNFNQTLGSE